MRTSSMKNPVQNRIETMTSPEVRSGVHKSMEGGARGSRTGGFSEVDLKAAITRVPGSIETDSKYALKTGPQGAQLAS